MISDNKFAAKIFRRILLHHSPYFLTYHSVVSFIHQHGRPLPSLNVHSMRIPSVILFHINQLISNKINQIPILFIINGSTIVRTDIHEFVELCLGLGRRAMTHKPTREAEEGVAQRVPLIPGDRIGLLVTNAVTNLIYN